MEASRIHQTLLYQRIIGSEENRGEDALKKPLGFAGIERRP